MDFNIAPSAKVAERNAKAESARLQGEAVLSAYKTTADSAVLGLEETEEGMAHETSESESERTMEYGSPKGGMK
ncbi:MAG: hypothetical protein EBT07_04865 [Actinobacteria bacterium]|nr:hypothetical protein [Actinomycetota bacterium]